MKRKQKKLKSNKSVGIYLRVSTLDQENGLISQRRALKDYCVNHGMKDRMKWYQDRLTGAETKRPAFLKLQKDVFNGKVDTIVVWALDRITRLGVKEGLDILIAWLDKKIEVISVREQLEFKGAQGEFLASVFFAIARMQREALRENTKRGLALAKAKGKKLGKRPLLFAKDIIPLLENGMTIEAIADKLGKTKMCIYNCLKRSGYKMVKGEGLVKIKVSK